MRKRSNNRNSRDTHTTLATKSRMIANIIGRKSVKSVYMEKHWNTVYIDEPELTSCRKEVEVKIKSLRGILGDF